MGTQWGPKSPKRSPWGPGSPNGDPFGNSAFIETPYKPHTPGSYASSMKIGSPQKNYLPQEKEATVTPSNLSYSAAAKKAGDVPQVSSSENLDVTF